MVGKSWSNAEEAYFWRHVAPNSHSREGVFVGTNQVVTWNDLAQRMANHFGRAARREYQGTLLYEHWFLNLRIRTRSPNAEPHLSRYLRRGGIPNPYTGATNAGQRQAAAVTAGTSAAPSAQVAANSGAAATTASPAVQGVAPGAESQPPQQEAEQEEEQEGVAAGESSDSDGL
ncbi:hypothetical protein PG994_002921 [Apiospora phragmitis]|uniref:Uncharacterized protein n=1 Tax=Apiospora phragmitis TaxID=2905665 RepID=A0ABR1WAC3_9PEZI